MKTIDNEEIKHSSRKKKLPFSKYENAVNCTNIVEWIKDNIAKSENGKIKVRIIDLIKELDIKFQNITYTAIYTALDYVFFKRGILVSLYTDNNGDKLLVLRLKKDTDKAPYWIEKLLEKEIDVEKLEENTENKPVIKRKIQLLQVIVDNRESRELENKEEVSKIGGDEVGREDVVKEIKEKTVESNRIRKSKKQKMLEGYLKIEFYDNPYKVDIFVFDFHKLGWKVKQSEIVYTNVQLLELLKQGISKSEDRRRIEITAIIPQKDIKDGKKSEGKNENNKLKEKKLEGKENKQPQEVEDKLNQLLPEKKDGEQNAGNAQQSTEQSAAIQYLIKRYRKSYPEKK